jgi:hypothetical protein
MLKVLAVCKFIALAAIGEAFSELTNSNIADWRSASFSAAWTQLHGFYASKIFHKLIETECFRSPLLYCELTALDDLLILSCQFLYGTIATQAATTPDSAKTNLVSNILKN